MSLPPGFLEELRSRLSLAQVAGRKLAWDTRKSNPGKGDMWAPCPFHQEKTASFHVDDRKGFYYCFGCHAKGDAITFVRETENMGFMEAVSLLAGEAGMTMPARDPQAAARESRRATLGEVNEMAVQHYRLLLSTAAAAEARAYLEGRGLGRDALERWEIGFAPDARRGLLTHLGEKGVDEALAVEAGLAARPDDGGAAHDRFPGRIIFPIRDVRGRAIGLGGRAMAPGARAKYLNSPETPLFDKGRSLYNHGPAREAAGKGAPLIVAEGYMDVIALVEAGFPATVAPLGTAITEDQLTALWRMAPEPLIALDGDTAGLRAAMRVMDLALPRIEAGQSLRFALMPEGMDPDDLLRAEGPSAVRARLEAALPMVELLWRRETEGRSFDSPERRAALDKALREALRRIGDASLRRHYGEALQERRRGLFGWRPPERAGSGPAPARGGSAGRRGALPGGRFAAPVPATAGTKRSFLAASGESAEEQLREAVILAALASCPEILPEFEGPLEEMVCRGPEMERLRDALLRLVDTPPGEVRAGIEAQIGKDALEKLLAQRHVAIVPAIRRPGDAALARQCVAEELAKLEARRGHARELAEAAQDLGDVMDEGLTWRLGEAARTLAASARGSTEDRTEYDTAPSGARIAKEERRQLDSLLQQIDFSRGGRPRNRKP